MTDPFPPPPDEPLPEQSRARIRADLLAAAQDGRGGSRRWLVPAVAAAAVLAVVGLAGWAIEVGGDDDGTPAVAGSSAAAVDPDPSEPSGKASLNLSTCVDPVGRMLAGAEQVAVFPAAGGGGGETTVWVAGGTFALCDERAGTTTVLPPRPLPPEESAATYDLSTVHLPTARGSERIRIAGGVVPEGAMVFDVDYTFPDGSVEHATTTVGPDGRTWWRMVHAEADGGLDSEAPTRVTVQYAGVQRSYELAPLG
jgi:hypothetical protein